MVLGKGLISLCVPVMNRRKDLERAIPTWIAAANASPPVEIFILDYNSDQPIINKLDAIMNQDIVPDFDNEVYLSGERYEGREHYHMAHAWNLAARNADGNATHYIFAGADALLDRGYIVALRQLIADGCVWMRGRHYKGIICVQWDEFETAGGYDERFEYSGEDKELDDRLRRRGNKFGLVPDGLVSVIRTPNSEKVKNRRGNLTKRQMMEHGARMRKANRRADLLVANQGKEWGTWK